jgi:large subunit ribosomal protein L25
MATATLKASRREGAGKGAARKLRGTGRVPAVLYGHGDRTESLSLNAHELQLLLHAIVPGSTIVRLEVDGEPTDVLIREIQRHPYRPEVVHVDLLHVHSDEPVKVRIPVRLSGTPVGVHTDGGVLDQVLYELEVQCLPGDIPDAADVDISGLGVGESVRVHDVSIPKVQVLNDPDLPIASVLAPRVSEEEPAEEAAAEPEVLRGARGAEDEG